MVNVSATANTASDSQIVRALTLPPETVAAGTPVAQATAPAEPVKEPSAAELKQAAKQLEHFMESMNRYLEFRIDRDSGRTVVTLKDKITGDTVRQIPTEEVLRLAQNLGGKSALLSQTA